MKTHFIVSKNILPEDVAIVQANDSMWRTSALPEEEWYVKSAVEKRKREFRAGRHAARHALAQLGYDGDRAIFKDSRRRPVWPAGAVGSITHTDGLCIAVAAHSSRYLGVGIDAETATPLPDQLRAKICTAEELVWARAHSQRSVIDWHKVLFCTKEAVFKLLNPIFHEEMGFLEISVSINTPDANAFHASLPDGRFAGLALVTGRYYVTDEYIVCSAWLDRSTPSGLRVQQVRSAHQA